MGEIWHQRNPVHYCQIKQGLVPAEQRWSRIQLLLNAQQLRSLDFLGLACTPELFFYWNCSVDGMDGMDGNPPSDLQSLYHQPNNSPADKPPCMRRPTADLAGYPPSTHLPLHVQKIKRRKQQLKGSLEHAAQHPCKAATVTTILRMRPQLSEMAQLLMQHAFSSQCNTYSLRNAIVFRDSMLHLVYVSLEGNLMRHFLVALITAAPSL